jgi:hypothetical protein
MTLSVRDITVGARLLVAFGFPMMLPLMSLVISSSMLTALMSLFDFLTWFHPHLTLFDIVYPLLPLPVTPFPLSPLPPPAYPPPPPPPPTSRPLILHHYTRRSRPSAPLTPSSSVFYEPSCSAISLFDPTTYRDVAYPESRFAMDEEITALEHTNTCDLAPRPPYIVPIMCKSVLHEEVYMHPPPSYYVPNGKVYRLHRSLYGLKQSPCALSASPVLSLSTPPRIIKDYIAFVNACLREW